MRYYLECNGCMMVRSKIPMPTICELYYMDCPCINCLVKVTCALDTCSKFKSFIEEKNNTQEMSQTF